MNPNGYIINFSIPRGDTGNPGVTGPTGPTGATGISGLKSYGGIYSNTITPINITNTTTPYRLILLNDMPYNNIFYNDLNNYTYVWILFEGLYEVNYGCVYSANVPVNGSRVCALSIFNNDDTIPDTVILDTLKNTGSNS